jgi:hypothetical protein
MKLEDLLTPFFARYNPETDEILNCKEGSIFWYHESRHRKQHKDGIIKKTANFELFMVLTIVALAFQDFFQARVFITIWVFYFSFFEVDAMIYMVYAKLKASRGSQKEEVKK